MCSGRRHRRRIILLVEDPHEDRDGRSAPYLTQEPDRHHPILRDRMLQSQEKPALVTEGVERRHPESATRARRTIRLDLDLAVRTEGHDRGHMKVGIGVSGMTAVGRISWPCSALVSVLLPRLNWPSTAIRA